MKCHPLFRVNNLIYASLSMCPITCENIKPNGISLFLNLLLYISKMLPESVFQSMFCTSMNGNSFFLLFIVQWGKDKIYFADLDSIKNSYITFPKICFFILILSPHSLSVHTHRHRYTHTVYVYIFLNCLKTV